MAANTFSCCPAKIRLNLLACFTAYEAITIVTQPSLSSHAMDSGNERRGRDEFALSAQEYIRKVVGDEDFKAGSWVIMVEFVNANGGIVNGCLGDIKNYLKNGKLEQVVAIIKSCTPNALGDLTITLKDLSGTIPGIIHYKVVNEEGYRKDINVGSALILTNVLVFSPKPSMHYLNITMRNVVKVCGNVTDQVDQYKLDEKALNFALEEEARLNRTGWRNVGKNKS
ncbi:hypothetical protein Tco_1162789 [Tanacetum coccineum]